MAASGTAATLANAEDDFESLIGMSFVTLFMDK